MKCKWCKTVFNQGPVKKIIRGKPYVFCSESCFRLWRYDVPWFDLKEIYTMWKPGAPQRPEPGKPLLLQGIVLPPFQELADSDDSPVPEGDIVIWDEATK